MWNFWMYGIPPACVRMSAHFVLSYIRLSANCSRKEAVCRASRIQGYFCNLRIGRPIELEDVSAIKKRMQEIIAEDIPFRRTECHTTEAVRVFSERGMNDKVKLLEPPAPYTPIIIHWEIR